MENFNTKTWAEFLLVFKPCLKKEYLFLYPCDILIRCKKPHLIARLPVTTCSFFSSPRTLWRKLLKQIQARELISNEKLAEKLLSQATLCTLLSLLKMTS